ncbi:MAG: diguanylate cyclase [Chloroflexi bacterium]|nr:diguanylate cyclase [Chloroflexota bacterium]
MTTEIQLRRMERILAISQELISTLSLEQILHNIVHAATELTDCETAAILLLDEHSNDTLRFAAVALYQDRLFDIPVPIAASIAGAAFTRAQPVIVNDARGDPHYYARVGDLIGYHAHSLLAVPLKFQDRKIGVLEAENKKHAHPFGETDAQVLTALAVQAAIAIENARQVAQYKQLAQSEQSQHQWADALRQASAALSSTLDYDQVIDHILEQLARVVPSDTSNVMMIEAEDLARVFRGRGYAHYGTADTLTTTTLNVVNAASLQQMRATRQPIVIPDVAQDKTWKSARPEHSWIRAYVGAPIIIQDQVVGFLNANSATVNAYTTIDAERLQTFACHAAIAIENARLYQQAQQEIAERIKAEDALRHQRDHLEEIVKERTAELHRLAITDPLTETFNRRHLFILGEQAFQHAQRYRHPLAALMIDLDHFKRINDRYGHAIGDQALKKLAAYLQSSLRAADILGRYGGEEFIALLPETDWETARQSAARLCQGIRALTIDTARDPLRFTVSIGVVAIEHVRDATLDALIQRADQAMYAAKQAGRDQVCTR